MVIVVAPSHESSILLSQITFICKPQKKNANPSNISNHHHSRAEEIRVDTDDSGVPDLDLSYNDDTECCGSDGTATQKTVGRVLLEQPQEWMLKFFHLVISLIFLGRGGGGGNPHRITKTATGGKTSQPQETKCNVQEEEKKEDDKGSIHNPPSV